MSNNPPQLNFSDLDGVYSEGGTLRTFDLTADSYSAIGAYEITNAGSSGYVDIQIIDLFNSALLEKYTDYDSSSIKGIAIVGIDVSRGSWSIIHNSSTVTLTSISKSNAYLVTKNSGAILRYTLDPSYVTSPSIASFRVIAWDTTNPAFTEFTYVNTLESPRPSDSSFSDPTYAYAYLVKSRPYIENSTNVIFDISYDVLTSTVNSSVITVDSFIQYLNYSTSVLSNTFYITDFYCTDVTATPLVLQYYTGFSWEDISTAPPTGISITSPLRLKSSTIDAYSIKKKYVINLKIRDNYVELYSLGHAIINVKISEKNVAPSVTYNGSIPPILNNITSNYPTIDLTKDFTWVDNNFSKLLHIEAYAISIVNSLGGKWYIYDNDNNHIYEASLIENQRLLLSKNCQIKYIPNPSASGVGSASIAVYAWDRGSAVQFAPYNTKILPLYDSVTGITNYPTGLFSADPAIVNIGVFDIPIAPEFVNSSGIYNYNLTPQDDNNSNTSGDTVAYTIDTIIGDDYVSTYTGGSGLAVVGKTSDPAVGVWQYRVAGGPWLTINTTSGSNALHLVSDTSGTAIRYAFTKTSAFANTYTTPTLSVRAWNGFNGIANGSTAAITTTGDKTSYSARTATLLCAINHINHPPILSPTNLVISRSVTTDSTHVLDISSLIVDIYSHYTENDAEQITRGISIIDISTNLLLGSVGGTLGAWSYLSSPLSLPFFSTTASGEQLIFTPAAYVAGSTILTIRLWDGVETSVNSFKYNLRVAVDNHAPSIVSGKIVCTPISKIPDNGSLGDKLVDLLGQLVISDADSLDPHGMVITAVSANLGQWQWSIQDIGGMPQWVNFPSNTSLLNGVHLLPNDNTGTGEITRIRFLPTNVGCLTSFAFYIWDSSNGIPNGQQVPLTFMYDDSSAYSAQRGTATIKVI